MLKNPHCFESCAQGGGTDYLTLTLGEDTKSKPQHKLKNKDIQKLFCEIVFLFAFVFCEKLEYNLIWI